MMLLETTNTYEAAWYIMNGAKLKDVKFKKTDSGTLFYTLVIDGIEERFIRYWYQYRPIGNIRSFADARLDLKQQIYEYKIKSGEMPQAGMPEQSNH